MQAHRATNIEVVRAHDRARYATNPARQAAQKKTAQARYAANREHVRGLARAYYRENPDVYERSRAKRKALLRGVEHAPYSRREIYERDGGACRMCDKPLPNAPGGFQIDHIVPISLGGPDIPANVQLACPSCNRKKWADLQGQIHLPV